MAFAAVRCLWRMPNDKIGTFTLRFELTGIGGGPGPGNLADMAEAATVESNTHVPTLFSADIAWDRWAAYTYHRVIGGSGPRFEALSVEHQGSTPPAVGAVSGTSSPPQTTLAIALKTGSPGRRHQGRVYTPPPPEAKVDGAGIVSDAVARGLWIREVAEAVEASLLGVADVDHIVHSVTYGSTAEVTTYAAGAVADTQRRRASRGR